VTTRVLVTGGTGKTGRRVITALAERGVVGVPAARAVPVGGIVFDWTDGDTWAPALRDADAVYLVAPIVTGDPAPLMIEFVETAMDLGVPRFVLLSGSPLEAGGPMMGQVHAWLAQSSAEWVVLRPSWFMENFSEGQHLATIREERAIYTATGQGRVPFLSTGDIALCAAHALTAPSAPNTDFVLTGAESLSYDDVAERLSTVIGERVTHVHQSFDEIVARHVARGLAPSPAQMLTFMDLVIADGGEDRTTTGVTELTARAPTSFTQFATDNAAVWGRG
jgi:ergot alkaloid biosynthesis protein